MKRKGIFIFGFALALTLAFQACQKVDNPALLVGGAPPGCTHPDSIGDMITSSSGTVACALVAFSYNLKEAATLTQFEVFGPSGGAYSIGLYADSGSYPTTLVSSAGPVTGTPFNWNVLPVSPVHLASGNYWLTVSLNSSTSIWVDTTGGTGSLIFNSCYSGVLPSPFPGGGAGAPDRVTAKADFCY